MKKIKNIDKKVQRLIDLKKSVIIASAGASTRLAGSKMTNQEVKKFLDSIILINRE